MNALGTSSVARIHRADSGVTAECLSCGVRLEQQPQFDGDIAVGTFFHCHPPSPAALHRVDVPAGWHVVDASP